LGLALALPGASLASTPRNILLIIADDFGADNLSLYNTNTAASLPPTPNIDDLAGRGVLFRNAWANPVCSPTRACLLTGRHGFRTGVGDVVAGAGNSLRAAEFTLPEAFATQPALGYQVAQFGKWHLSNGPGSPNSVGAWPHFAGSLGGALASYTNWTQTVNGVSTTRTNYATTDLVNDAIAWIQARGSAPWFAWVAFNAPHSPLHKPPAALAPHYTGLSGTQPNINANPRAYYEALVESMDTELGRLLAAVDRTNTHIIFLGDNGTPANVLQPPYPAGRGKDTLYQGGLRVPLIAAGPAVVSPGRTSDALVHAVDVFATICDLAGLPGGTVPTNVMVDSRSFLAVLAGQAYAPIRLYAESFNSTNPTDGGRALRDDRYKLIRFNDGHDEFYDLQADPYETGNLLAGSLTAGERRRRDRLEFWRAGYSTNTGPRLLAPLAGGGNFSVTLTHTAGASYKLWRCDDLAAAFWSPVTAQLRTNATTLVLTDPAPLASRAFYSVIQHGP